MTEENKPCPCLTCQIERQEPGIDETLTKLATNWYYTEKSRDALLHFMDPESGPLKNPDYYIGQMAGLYKFGALVGGSGDQAAKLLEMMKACVVLYLRAKGLEEPTPEFKELKDLVGDYQGMIEKRDVVKIPLYKKISAWISSKLLG